MPVIDQITLLMRDYLKETSDYGVWSEEWNLVIEMGKALQAKLISGKDLDSVSNSK